MAQTPPLAYDHIMRRPPQVGAHSWSARDAVIYNLGIGFGEAAIRDPRLLAYVLEERPRVFPTMVSILGMQRGPWNDPDSNIDATGVLHGEESIRIVRPLAVEGRLISSTRVAGIWDKGPGRGAVMRMERTLTDPNDGQHVATVGSSLFLRNNGGFGGSSHGAPQPPSLPDRAPDGYRDMATRPEQALLYRLAGDRNPLHADPEAARQAGFGRPILMGLCTFAIVARALVDDCADADGDCLQSLSVRFSGVVFPGETVRVEYWKRNGSEVVFRARVTDRESFVLTGGRAIFR